MRTEQEMLDLILRTASQDDRVRAVLLNGSRANPQAHRDIFQDFDVVYLVTDVESFREDSTWPRRFGELMIMQMPEDMQDPAPAGNGSVVYLMQFMDGNRVDLGIYPLASLDDVIADSLTVVLLDKDGLVPPLPSPDERGYLPNPPTARQFADCCNEFWWCAPYVAKGLWRGQIIYAKFMLDQALRDQLMKMLSWHIGTNTGFRRNPGSMGKYLKECLEPELWAQLMSTYSDADIDRTWDALFEMSSLFRRVAVPVAEHCGFEYPYGDDQRVSAHLQHVRRLPKDAQKIY